MKYSKIAGFIIAIIFLMSFTACNGDGGSNKGTPLVPGAGSDSTGSDNNPRTVSISITQSLNMLVGETKTLQVIRRNTDDFTVSVSPASGSDCMKTGNDAVICVALLAGTYAVTVTATADTSKSATAVLTVKQEQSDLPTDDTDDTDNADNADDADDDPPVSTVNTSLLLQLVNSYRTAGYNCGYYGYFGSTDPVTWDNTLEAVAYDHSLDMSTNYFFSHTGSNGSSPGDRLTQHGYIWTTYGENIARGYRTEKAVIDGWIANPGHCANIMNPLFKEMGIAMIGNYWTLDLGARDIRRTSANSADKANRRFIHTLGMERGRLARIINKLNARHARFLVWIKRRLQENSWHGNAASLLQKVQRVPYI